ncbi:MAG: hypothetical protein KF850_42860, partial [Labilithrix sp.]|nr:hypothetical protein [Labilithrix sp.]
MAELRSWIYVRACWCFDGCLPRLTGLAQRGESTMGVMDFVKNGVREMMIARPDHFKHLIV